MDARIIQTISPLVNLPLAIARDAGTMKNFQFGTVRPHPSGKGTVGDFALHVQCSWRIVKGDRIMTGSADYYQPAAEGEELNLEDRKLGNLQRKRLLELLGNYDDETRSHINKSLALNVTGVRADRFGGLDLTLSGGVSLQVFPNGSLSEDWRFFAPGTEDPHLVLRGGKLL